MTYIPPKKSLGQNFLRCGWVTQTMIHAGDITAEDTILEIGPGTGLLTRALGIAAGRVIGVEKDERLSDELRTAIEKEKIRNVTIIPGDILRAFSAIAKACRLKPNAYKVVSNIPYYLTSRLLRLLFEEKIPPRTIVLTVQKEVAERISEKPPRMNLLALSAQCYGTPKIVKIVPASCFFPQPKIESAIIKITAHQNPAGYEKEQREAVFQVAKVAFSQKRKTLGASLKKNYPRERIISCLKKCSLPETSRPQELSLIQWMAFAQCLGVNPKDKK